MFLKNIPWQVLIIGGAVLTSIGQIFNKYQSHQATALQTLLYKYISSVILITSFWWFVNQSIPNQSWIFLLYGFCTVFVVVLWTKASRYSLSKTILVSPVSNIFSILLAAIIFSEWKVFNILTTSGKLMLISLLLIPIIQYLFYEKSKKSAKWSFLVLLATISFGSFKLFQKHFLNKVEPIQFLMLQYWGSLLMVFSACVFKKYDLFVNKKFRITGLLQGLLTSTGILLYLSGLKKATISEVVLLRMPILLILTSLFGLFIFKEIKEMTFKKWIGIILSLVVASLVIISNH